MYSSGKSGNFFIPFRPVETEVKQPLPIHNNGNGTGGGRCDRTAVDYSIDHKPRLHTLIQIKLNRFKLRLHASA